MSLFHHKSPETADRSFMKYFFASDIHGSAYYCKKMLDAYNRFSAGDRTECRLVLLGDILYHGPRNDLPADYAPKQVAAMLNEYADSILCVKGNCEAEVDQMMLSFPIMADYALLEIDGRRIYLTHGHHFNIDNPLPMCEGDIMIYGHTHVPIDETRNFRRFLNPGSVSIPKQDSGHGYIVYENGNFERRLLI